MKIDKYNITEALKISRVEYIQKYYILVEQLK